MTSRRAASPSPSEPVTDSPTSVVRPRFAAAGRRAVPYVFLAPYAIAFILFLIAPVIVAIVDSLFSFRASGLGLGGLQNEFVGIANYLRALGDQDFIQGFVRVLGYGAIQIPVMLVIATVLALVLDTRFAKGVRAAQFIIFLPYAVPVVIGALLWGFLYQPGSSPIVQGLGSLGIDVDFLAPETLLVAIGNIATWSSVGFNMVILYAALQSIPTELHEAARIDGASELRIALGIKLPMIAPALLLATLSSVITTLQLFNEPKVLQTITTSIPSDFTPNMAVYFTATLGRDPNLASAMAVIIGIVTMAISIAGLVLTRRRNGIADGI